MNPLTEQIRPMVEGLGESLQSMVTEVLGEIEGDVLGVGREIADRLKENLIDLTRGPAAIRAEAEQNLRHLRGQAIVIASTRGLRIERKVAERFEDALDVLIPFALKAVVSVATHLAV